MFNVTERRTMEQMEPRFRHAWVQALSQEEGAPVIAALANMLEFDDTWELALSELSRRVNKYPKSVAQQVIYSLRRNDSERRYQLSLHALTQVPQAELNAALNNAKALADGERFVRKLRRDLRSA